MKCRKGHSTVEYLIGAGVVIAIALFVFIYTLLPASEDVKDQENNTYYSDYYQSVENE